jgi:NADH dehydrogenase [ubiquinone] 1 alpha subcomplex assembly factor 1
MNEMMTTYPKNHLLIYWFVAINLEGLSMPLKPYPILDFGDPETSTWMKTMTDVQSGGFSIAELTQVPAKGPSPAHMLFHGNISTQLPLNRPDVQRTGYAAWRNQNRGRSLFGELYWDVDSYMYLALRVKSDGRKYFVNIQTDSIVETDIHQHRLYTKEHQNADGKGMSAEWETVLIKLHEFVRTNHGMVTEPQSEMLRQKVKSVGIGLIDRNQGPFELGVASIWATNLNERKQVDGRIGWEEGDQESARLGNVTEEKMVQREEEKRKLPAKN